MADEKPTETAVAEVLPPRVTFPLKPGHAFIQKPAPVSLAEQKLATAAREDDKLRKEARAVVEAMSLAAEIDDDDVETDDKGRVIARKAPEIPESWSPKAARIARDARRKRSEAPFYLQSMLDIHRAYTAADATRGDHDKPINVGFVAMNVNLTVYQYGGAEYPVDEEQG